MLAKTYEQNFKQLGRVIIMSKKDGKENKFKKVVRDTYINSDGGINSKAVVTSALVLGLFAGLTVSATMAIIRNQENIYSKLGIGEYKEAIEFERLAEKYRPIITLENGTVVPYNSDSSETILKNIKYDNVSEKGKITLYFGDNDEDKKTYDLKEISTNFKAKNEYSDDIVTYYDAADIITISNLYNMSTLYSFDDSEKNKYPSSTETIRGMADKINMLDPFMATLFKMYGGMPTVEQFENFMNNDATEEQINSVYKLYFPDSTETDPTKQKDAIITYFNGLVENQEKHEESDILTSEQKELLGVLKEQFGGNLPSKEQLQNFFNNMDDAAINELYKQYLPNGKATTSNAKKLELVTYINGLVKNQEKHSNSDILTSQQKELLDALKEQFGGKLPSLAELKAFLKSNPQLANLVLETYGEDPSEFKTDAERLAKAIELLGGSSEFGGSNDSEHPKEMD